MQNQRMQSSEEKKNKGDSFRPEKWQRQKEESYYE
jgi:hypothetical protein